MREILAKVTEAGGSATRATVPGFRVAGKTGTARKFNPDTKSYYEHRYVTSFAGMMPAENPAFVCYVMIDDPKTTAVPLYGGTIAAPIFSRIAARLGSFMNLPRNNTDDSENNKVVSQ